MEVSLWHLQLWLCVTLWLGYPRFGTHYGSWQGARTHWTHRSRTHIWEGEMVAFLWSLVVCGLQTFTLPALKASWRFLCGPDRSNFWSPQVELANLQNHRRVKDLPDDELQSKCKNGTSRNCIKSDSWQLWSIPPILIQLCFGQRH